MISRVIYKNEEEYVVCKIASHKKYYFQLTLIGEIKMKEIDPSDFHIPFLWKLISIMFSIISNRCFCMLFSILLLMAGYIIDSFSSNNFYLTSFSALIIFIGLILTIKNHYLTNLTSMVKMASAFDGGESSMGESMEYHLRHNIKYRNSVIERANDEGVGILIIFIGTLFNAFGSLIPLCDFNFQ